MKKLFAVLLMGCCFLMAQAVFSQAEDLPICPPPADGGGKPSHDMKAPGDMGTQTNGGQQHMGQPPQGGMPPKYGTLPNGQKCQHPKPPHEGGGGAMNTGKSPRHMTGNASPGGTEIPRE